MTGVIASGPSTNEIVFVKFGQMCDDFALGFVSPIETTTHIDVFDVMIHILLCGNILLGKFWRV